MSGVTNQGGSPAYNFAYLDIARHKVCAFQTQGLYTPGATV